MFPRNADEARHFEHQMTLRESCRRAREAVRRDPRTRIAVVLANGAGRLEGAWISCERGVDLFDHVDGRVVRTTASTDDVMAVVTVAPVENAGLVMPGAEQEAVDEALVRAAFLHDGDSLATAFSRAGMEPPVSGYLGGFDEASPVMRAAFVAQLRPAVAFRQNWTAGSTVSSLLATIRDRHRTLGVDDPTHDRVVAPFEAHRGEPADDLPEPLGDRLRALLGETGAQIALDKELEPFMDGSRLLAEVARFVAKA